MAHKKKINYVRLYMYVKENPTISIDTLQKVLGCGERVIKRGLKKLGIKTYKFNVSRENILNYMRDNLRCTIKDLADHFKMGTTKMKMLLNKHGLKTKRYQGMPTKEDILKMIKTKYMPCRRIAQAFGCSEATVRDYMKKFGIYEMWKDTYMEKMNEK